MSNLSSLSTSWLFWAILSAVFAAATAILAKAGVEKLHPDVATWFRTGIIWAVLTLVLIITGKSGTVLDVTRLNPGSALVLGLSALATAASWFCYFRALSMGQASQVAPIDKLSIVLVAVFAVLFLGETVNTQNWVGIGFITVGTVLVALS